MRIPSWNSKLSGIYAIYSEVNGRTYIGSAVDLYTRWAVHQSFLRKGAHVNPHLQNAWNKYGPDAFEFSVVEECPVDQLLVREQYWLNTCAKKYNILLVAGSRLGATHSEETKAKMSATRKGRKQTPEHIAKRALANTGRVVSEETREKIRATLIERNRIEREKESV